ncbi:MAG: thymidine phosphorylase [Verrucomicrobia bacterium]|nr:MAG: thymidine phosphorylase [Verrucomicrobiota bacterium]
MLRIKRGVAHELCQFVAMHVPTIIARKREGEELSSKEISKIIQAYAADELPDYQMAALAMAIYFRGMNSREIADLTRAMMDSGERFEHRDGHPPVVDKHSTGGIGDKVSLILAPLVACAGCWVPMVSGRGLGITGGTLDKLESIPRFQVRIPLDQASAQLEKIGVVMMGQTEKFCPADRKLYSLRDVTGTVPSIALITASIMSKKLAESLDRLVLDVKYGSGAFMKNLEQATALAASMSEVGKAMGVEIHTSLNAMDEPLGRAVGNALEVAESIDCLNGGGPEDLRKIVLDLSEMITTTPRVQLEKWLDDGTAREKFDQIVIAQNGNPDDLNRLLEIHRAPIIRDVIAGHGGTVQRADAGMIGQASLQLGCGRAKASDEVDFAVGFDQLVKCGESIHAGQAVCRIHARSAVDFEMAEALIERAVVIG